jgi:hypothetical protein
MPTYQFSFYQFQDFSFTGTAGSTSQTVAVTGGFTLGLGAAPVPVTVMDDDPTFHDGFEDPNPGGLPSTANNDQRLAGAVTVNGTSYPAGSQIELEFAVSTTSTQGPQVVFYYVRIGGVNVGIAASGAELVPGVTYTITGTRDGSLAPQGSFPADVVAAVPWDVLICFTAGTLIDTPDGPRPIETLEPGDLVTTLDNGSQPVRWIGSRHVTGLDLARRRDLQPVEFAPGVLGNTRALLVSPQHRMLLTDWRAQVYFGEDQVLVPAKALVNGASVRQLRPEGGVTYIHLLFDRHEIILSEGALSESFHPGETGLGALDADQRREVERLFPGASLALRRAAFPVVKAAEARALRLPS